MVIYNVDISKLKFISVCTIKITPVCTFLSFSVFFSSIAEPATLVNDKINRLRPPLTSVPAPACVTNTSMKATNTFALE